MEILISICYVILIFAGLLLRRWLTLRSLHNARNLNLRSGERIGHDWHQHGKRVF